MGWRTKNVIPDWLNCELITKKIKRVFQIICSKHNLVFTQIFGHDNIVSFLVIKDDSNQYCRR